MWPKGKGKQACVGCSGRCVKCLLGGQPVTNRLLKADGPVKKKPWVMSKPVIESEDNESVVEVTTPVKPVGIPTKPQADWVFGTSGVERALWAIASGIGGLAEDEQYMRQVLTTELRRIWEALEHQGD